MTDTKNVEDYSYDEAFRVSESMKISTRRLIETVKQAMNEVSDSIEERRVQAISEKDHETLIKMEMMRRALIERVLSQGFDLAKVAMENVAPESILTMVREMAVAAFSMMSKND